MNIPTKNNYNGFKLISLELIEVIPFGTIKYSFIDENDLQNKLYTTVIIGANGTSKSNLFRLIINIFKMIESVKLNSNPVTLYNDETFNFHAGRFTIKYSIDNVEYEFSGNANKKYKTHEYERLKINGADETDFTKIKLPKTILANSFSITDKFPVPPKKKSDESLSAFDYKYLGIKYNPQSASTKSYIKRTIDLIANSSNFESLVNGLEIIAKEFSGDNKTIKLVYKPQNIKRFFNENLSFESVENYFKDIENDYKSKPKKEPPFQLTTFNRLVKSEKDVLLKAIEYCRNLLGGRRFTKLDGSGSFGYLYFDLTNQEHLEQLKNENVFIKTLCSIKLLSSPILEFQTKGEETYTLDDASSGEHNLITSLIGLVSSITPNSLLLIDEPEISLHPNWQMKYIHVLKKIFAHADYSSCHSLIATHSHFLVSDLEKDSSSVVAIKKENGKIEIVNSISGIDTFGWSAEEVLYSVFNVRSTRNYFLEYDLTKLVTLVNRNSDEYEEIRRIVDKISTLVISEGDPLRILKEKAEKYLQKNNA